MALGLRLKSSPASMGRRSCANGTPVTVKPRPVEAKASAASGVTSSKACCQAREMRGLTIMVEICMVVAARTPRVEIGHVVVDVRACECRDAALVPIPKRSTSPRAASTLNWWIV